MYISSASALSNTYKPHTPTLTHIDTLNELKKQTEKERGREKDRQTDEVSSCVFS